MILVTGGTGFLGSTLIRQLLTSGKKVRATKRPTSQIPADLSKHPQMEWVDAALNNYFELQDAFSGATQVYHCAAFVSLDPQDRQQLLETNVEGTAHVANLALENGVRLLHVSSIAAIGEPAPNKQLATENDIWEFNGKQSSYAISKYEAEMEVWRSMEEGLDAVIINPSVIIGAHAGESGSGALFYTVKRGLPYYPTGSIGVVDVEDVATIAIALMESDISHERFILNAENLSYQSLFQKTAQYLGVQAPTKKLSNTVLQLTWRAAKLASIFNGKRAKLTKDTVRSAQKKQAYSNEKIRKLLDFHFKPIDHSLQDIAIAINNHGSNHQ
ncbi:NAD-dependent epimerase/dehydratase family protein [Olivibacter sitiensis]|uniref:NAD-dependent epimerase/dehydratase family protein n=1 Tax=Olivibacter sitiensis TaxID=376470 RepID=UPI0003FD8672|nr:NAD-dependent epimerase/dehydratase family protein [Olivibacter sitiensis]